MRNCCHFRQQRCLQGSINRPVSKFFHSPPQPIHSSSARRPPLSYLAPLPSFPRNSPNSSNPSFHPADGALIVCGACPKVWKDVPTPINRSSPQAATMSAEPAKSQAKPKVVLDHDPSGAERKPVSPAFQRELGIRFMPMLTMPSGRRDRHCDPQEEKEAKLAHVCSPLRR